MTKRNFWVGTCAAMLAVSLSVGIGVTVHNTPVAAEAVTTVEGVWKYADEGEGVDYYVAVKEEAGKDDYFGYMLFYVDAIETEGYIAVYAFSYLYEEETAGKYATVPAAEVATATDFCELECKEDGSAAFVMTSDGDPIIQFDQCSQETFVGADFSGKWTYEDGDDGIDYDYSFDLDAMTGTYINNGDEEPQEESFDAHFVMGNVAAFFAGDDLQENCFVFQKDADYFFSNSFGGVGQLTATEGGGGGGDTGDTGETATSVEGKWTFAEDDMFAWVDLVEEQEYAGVYVVIVFDGDEPYSVMFGFLTQDDEDQSIYTDETSMFQLGFQLNEAKNLSMLMYGEEYSESTAYTALPTESSLSGKMGGLDYAGATLVIDFTSKSVESDTYGPFSSNVTIGDVPVFYESGEEETTYVVGVSHNGKVYAVVYADMDYDLVELGEYKDQLTVTYAKGADADDATVPAAITVAFGGNTKLPDATTAQRTGYKLLGWTCPDYMDGEQLNPGTSIVVVKDLTFTAVWILDVKYTVSFSAGEGVTGATVPNSVQVQNGELLNEESLSPEPSRDGYAFSHWEKNGVEYNFSDPVTEGFTLTAVWDAVVTYYFKGNYAAKGYDVFEDTETYNVTKLSFTLTGDKISNLKYALADGVMTEATAQKASTNNRDLSEVWEEADLYFSFHLDEEFADIYFFVSKDRTKVVFATKYASVDSDAIEKAFVTDPDGGKPVVTFDLGGGTDTDNAAAAQVVEAGQHATAPTKNPTKAHYDFVGWYTEASGGNVFDFGSTAINEDTTVYAHWTAHEYTITFSGDGVSETAVKYTVESASVTLPNPVREGYTFGGWQQNGEAFSYVQGETTGDITLTAKWVAKQTTVTFQAGDHGTLGAGDSSKTFTYDQAATLPTPTPAKGYEFKEWQLNGVKFELGADNKWNKEDSSLTLTAVYTAKTYNFTWNAGTDGTSTTGPASAAFDGSVTLPTVTANAGKKFEGWYIGETKIENAQAIWAYVAAHESETTVTFTAKYSDVKYTVHFNSHEGSAVADVTNVAYNTKITAPTDPTREGYTFDGWFKDDACTQAFDFENDKITGETTLHAKWTAVSTETPGDNAGDTTDGTTDGDKTEDKDDKGCGGAIAAPVAMIASAVLMVGVALVIRKKHSEN